MRNALGERVLLAGDENDIASAAQCAAGADMAIVVVGYTAEHEGEYIPGEMTAGVEGRDETGKSKALGGDRDNLGLPPEQVALINAVVAANRKTLVVVVAGSAVLMTDWIDIAPAVIQTFYSGMEGGNALADLVLGLVSPSGKLPFTVMRQASDYPHFDKDADSITYGPLHGYTLAESRGIAPLFPFGHGLSYTCFDYDALTVSLERDTIAVGVRVTNSGACTGREITQLYVGFPDGVERPHKLLRGFVSTDLAAGEFRMLSFDVDIDDLRYWDETGQGWRLVAGDYRVYVGADSHAAETFSAPVTIKD